MRNFNLLAWKERHNVHLVTHQVAFQPIVQGWIECKMLWKKSEVCKFISNVIGMASVGINLIKIIGVHPLYVILYRGWGHFMLAISSKLKRGWRWITFPLLAEIIQFVNFFWETHIWENVRVVYYFNTPLPSICITNCLFLEIGKRGVRNNSIIKWILLNTDLPNSYP